MIEINEYVRDEPTHEQAKKFFENSKRSTITWKEEEWQFVSKGIKWEKETSSCHLTFKDTTQGKSYVFTEDFFRKFGSYDQKEEIKSHTKESIDNIDFNMDDTLNQSQIQVLRDQKIKFPSTFYPLKSKENYPHFRQKLQSFKELNKTLAFNEIRETVNEKLPSEAKFEIRNAKTLDEVVIILDDIYQFNTSPTTATVKLCTLNVYRPVLTIWSEFLELYQLAKGCLNQEQEVMLSMFRDIMKNTPHIPWESLTTTKKMTQYLSARGPSFQIFHEPSFNKQKFKKPYDNKKRLQEQSEKKNTSFKQERRTSNEKKDTQKLNRIARGMENPYLVKIKLFASEYLDTEGEFDPGADSNFMPKKVAEKIGAAFEPANLTISLATVHEIKATESCNIDVYFDETWKNLRFYIAELDTIFLGKPAMEAFGVNCSAQSLTIKKRNPNTESNLREHMYIEGKMMTNLPIRLNFTINDGSPITPTMPLYSQNLYPVMECLLAYLTTKGFIERDIWSSPHTLSCWPKLKSGKEQAARSWKPNSEISIDRIYRLLIDASTLNERILPQEYGSKMPTINEFKLKCSAWKYKTRIDLRNAFFGIKMPAQFRHLFAFNTHLGKYRMVSLPQGAVFSPKFLQANLSIILQEFQQKNHACDTLNYADDIWLFTQQKEAQIIENLTAHLRKYGFEIAEEKTEKFVEEFVYGGFTFKKNGILPLPSHLSKIDTSKQPLTKRAWLKFIGIIEFIAAHLPSLSLERRRIQKYLDNPGVTLRSKIEVNQETTQIFKNLKRIATNPKQLELPNTSKDLYLIGDAGKSGCSYVLCQDYDENSLNPLEEPSLKKIGFYSKTLTHNLDDPNLVEQDGINAACEHFKPLLAFWPKKIIVYNDNQNVTQKRPRTEAMVHKKQKLVEKGIFLTYRKIERNKVNLLDEMGKLNRIKVMELVEIPTEMAINSPEKVELIQPDLLNLKEKLIRFDIPIEIFIEACRKEKTYLIGLKKADRNSNFELTFAGKTPIVLFKGCIVIPAGISEKFFKKIHEEWYKHVPDGTVTECYLKEMGFHMPQKTLKKFIASCNHCAVRKFQNSRIASHENKSIQLDLKPFHTIWIDIFFLKKKEFLLIIDDTTNFIITRPLPNKSSEQINLSLEQIFNIFAIRPEKINPDAEHVFDFLKNSYSGRTSFPYRHQGNKAENGCRSIKRLLRLLDYDDETEIEKAISEATFLHNYVYKRHLDSSPVKLLYGSNEEDIATSFKKRTEQQQRDAKRGTRKVNHLEVDDFVLKRNHIGSNPYYPTFYLVKEIGPTWAKILEYGEEKKEPQKISLRDLKIVFRNEESESQIPNSLEKKKTKKQETKTSKKQSLSKQRKAPPENKKLEDNSLKQRHTPTNYRKKERKLELRVINYDKPFKKYVLSDNSRLTEDQLTEKHPDLLDIWKHTKQH